MKFAIAQDSRRGGRPYNQDRIGYAYSRDALLVVVADGMGGHMHGEVASQVTVELMTDLFKKQATPTLANPWRFLEDALFRAHDAIFNYATNHALLETPRTTCVTCVIQDDIIYWAHVGDSRLYLIQKGCLSAITRDHSKVQQMVDAGMITAEEAEVHPERNKIYNCLGGIYPPDVELGGKLAIDPGDAFLLCTDGVWGSLSEEDIVQYLGAYPAHYALPQLMDRAERTGGDLGDNLSGIAVTWLQEDEVTSVNTVSTQTLPLDAVTTELKEFAVDKTGLDGKDINDKDIERVIAEIQATINKFSR
jgi:serine/threonine protein phosphatase PrpC